MKNIRHLCFLLLCPLLFFSCGREEMSPPASSDTFIVNESDDIDRLITLAQTTFAEAVADLPDVEITQTINGTCENYGSDYCLYEYHYDWLYGSGQYGILLEKVSTGEWLVMAQGEELQASGMCQIITNLLQ